MSAGRTLDAITKKRTRKLIDEALRANDAVRFAIQANTGFGMVALQDRLMLARYGLVAGSTFGGSVSQFRYTDILNVAVSTGMITGVIEIQTAAHQGSSVGDFWSLGSGGGTSKSPHEADNAFPRTKSEIKEWKPYLDELQDLIEQATSGSAMGEGERPSEGGNRSLSAEFAQLAELRAAGVLSEAEFRKANQRLLGDSTG